MREVTIKGGRVALVDDEDFERVNQFKWYIQANKSNTYAMRISVIDGKDKKIYLHRFILNLENSTEKLDVDHINHNSLDNRKINLRACTRTQNMMNATFRKKSFSKYKGVSLCKDGINFRARIKINKIEIQIGRFANEIEAAKAYDEAAKKYYGEFCYINFHD